MDYTCTRKPKQTENQTPANESQIINHCQFLQYPASKSSAMLITQLRKIKTKSIRTKLQVLYPSLIFRHPTKAKDITKALLILRHSAQGHF